MSSTLQGSARFPLLLKLLFTLCVALTGMATVALIVASVDLTRSNREVEHTLHMQQALETLQLALVNAETGQRGFLLTGQSHFLQPYVDAVARQAYTIGALEHLAAGNPTLQSEVQALKGIADEALRHMATLINTQADAATRLDDLNRGRVLMDRARVAIDAMRAEQDSVLTARKGEADQRSRYGIGVLLISDATSLFGLALLFFGTRAYHRRRILKETVALERESALDRLLEDAPVGLAECEAPSGRILRPNRRLAEITGWTQDELRRTSILDLLPRANKLDNARAYRELAQGGHDFLLWEQPMQCKAGDPIWVEVRISRIGEGTVESDRTIVSVEDIGVRKRAEQLLVGREALLRSLVENTHQIAFAKGMDGRYLFANAALQAALERDDDDIVGRFDVDLFPPDCAEALGRNDALVRESRLPQTFEQTLEFGAELRTYILVEAPFYDDADELAGVVGLATDITERARLESNLRAALNDARKGIEDGMEEVIRAIEQERARVAMELHDELGATISAVWVQLVGMSAPLKNTAPHLLARHEAALDALTGMSGQLRLITAGLRPLLLDALGLEPALARYVSDWSVRTAVRAQLRTNEPDLLPLTAEQELTVYRIVQEALNNVQKHANATRVEVELIATGAELRVIVNDDGVGISDEARRDPTSRGINGMRERLRVIGGTLWIDRRSPDGRGTHLSARIPLTG